MALSKLTILNERYVLRNMIGEPGLYDATYLAWNLMKKETAVVIREFNPTFLMTRSENGENLIPTSGPAERLFEYGLNCFVREADATGLIQHPNVIHQQTYFRENSTAYSISDYHPGATLSAVLKGQAGKLQERAAFAIIVPLLDGLIAGHRKGLIHGRLSPGQIFLTKSGRPMLLRFHVTQILLARRCGRASDISTPGYTPPELLRSDGKKGPWSDVYASGATLYSIITGKRPPEAMKRFDHDPLPDILHREADISKGLKKVLNRAMALDWNERPQTIQELKQEILEKMPATSRPYTPGIELKATEQENEAERENELQKARRAAEEIAVLSREALAQSPLKVGEPNPPAIALSLEDIDSQEARQWLPDFNNKENLGDGFHSNGSPVLDTNPLGPLGSDLTFLSPNAKQVPLTAHEIDHLDSSSPLNQVVQSATANRTRKLSVAAIAACILLFAANGIRNELVPRPANEMPPPVQAAEPIVISAASPNQVYALLLGKADSLQQLAHAYLLEGDTIQRTQIYAEAYDVYQQILIERPADSLAIAQMRRLNSLKQSLEIKNTQASDSSETLTPVLTEAMIIAIEEGDSLMASRQFDAARSAFENVLSQVPDNTHAAAMLEQIDYEITQIARQKEFRRLVSRGEIFLQEDSLTGALKSFSQALNINPKSKSVLVKLRNVEGLIAKKEAVEVQFLSLKNQGDNLFALQSYSSALISYESAQLLRPDDLYLEAQIKAVKDSLKMLENIVKKQDSQYNQYKNTADSLYNTDNLDEALSFYRIAEALKPSDPFIQQRIARINEAKQVEENLPIDEEGIFLIPEVMPEMINNSSLVDRIVYPAEARRNGIEGMVIVRMMVDEEGQVSRMKVLKGIGYGCDREALRVLRKAQFAPATFKGKSVKAWHTHPIKFKLLR